MAGAREDANDSSDDPVYTIDGRHCGTITRFINHSCDPNLATYAVASDRRDGKVYNLALFTTKTIPAKEELTFSYNDRTPQVLDMKQMGEKYMQCLCKTPNCTGYIWKY
jgi:SET domain-containing protein